MTKDLPRSSEQQIRSAISALASDDALIQNSAVEELIKIGPDAVPELIKAVQQPETNHAQAMYALAQIGDSQSAEAFVKDLQHDNEQVRAYAAQGLVRINHPDALNACLQTINDGADELHLDITPAVAALANMGLVAVPSLLNLLLDDDEMTRLHTQRALEILINQRHGFIPGQGFPAPEAEQAACNEWQANGNYDYSTDEASRKAAVNKWKEWLKSARRGYGCLKQSND